LNPKKIRAAVPVCEAPASFWTVLAADLSPGDRRVFDIYPSFDNLM
jgi:hypothetical protein